LFLLVLNVKQLLDNVIAIFIPAVKVLINQQDITNGVSAGEIKKDALMIEKRI
jgi:hypothetical protein